MKTVLSIAGTDPSGGAGMSADLKTFTAFGVYGMAVITAVVAQNTSGVFDVSPVETALIQSQMDAVWSDIVPDAVKIGMVFSSPIIDVITRTLKSLWPSNVVLDPVMVSTSGHRLLETDAELSLLKNLLPLVHIVTPNIPEAEVLCGFPILCREDMVRSATCISNNITGAVLIKGGHLEGSSDDFLLFNKENFWFRKERIATSSTHGTGCTLSSAIASGLALGHTIPEAVEFAKDYLSGAIAAAPGLGKGNGPVNHCWKQSFPV